MVEVGSSAWIAASVDAAVDAVPEYRHGRRRGLRIGQCRPGSLLSELQLREGDLVTMIAGFACDDLLACRSGVQALQRALRERVDFELLVERDGRLVTLTVRWAAPSPLPDGG